MIVAWCLWFQCERKNCFPQMVWKALMCVLWTTWSVIDGSTKIHVVDMEEWQAVAHFGEIFLTLMTDFVCPDGDDWVHSSSPATRLDPIFWSHVAWRMIPAETMSGVESNGMRFSSSSWHLIPMQDRIWLSQRQDNTDLESRIFEKMPNWWNTDSLSLLVSRSSARKLLCRLMS